MKFALKTMFAIILATSSLNLYSAVSPLEDQLTAEMSKPSIIRSYFAALEANEYEAIIRFFAADAVVISTSSGTKSASELYRGIGDNSLVTLRGIYTSEETPNTVLTHAVHDWKLRNDRVVSLEFVYIFEFSATNLITSLKIICDTRPLLEAFETLATE